jgi:hypothetical protein
MIPKLETVPYLFAKCNSTKACWVSIGVSFPYTRPILQILNNIDRKTGCSILYGDYHFDVMKHLDIKK